MKLEVHTFDPELLCALMSVEPVPEGEMLELDGDARVVYVRTFTGRVKHFPQILHFEVELLNEKGPTSVSEWLFSHIGRRSIDRILVDYQDIRMDAARFRDALRR